MPQLVLAYLQSIWILFPLYSAIQNEISVPGGSVTSVGTCKSAEKSTEEVPQRESQSSSIRSDSESDSDQENSTPRTSHCTLRDDECVETFRTFTV